MAKFKPHFARPSIMMRVRKQRLRYISMLPSLITLLNAIMGFVAMGFASRGAGSGAERYFFHKPELTYFAMAAYMIFGAMIADMLDGRVARLSKSTSSFGGQLDSLCDVISFGAAPAFLMLRMLESKLTLLTAEHITLGPIVTKFVWLCAAVYVSCAAIRLARFNVENEEDESAHMNFWGLPSPAAAGVVVSIVVFQQDMLPVLASKTSGIYHFIDGALIWGLPLVTFFAGILMVTRIRYPHLANQLLRGKKPFTSLIWVLLCLLLVIWQLQLMLMLAFCGFAIWGVVHWLIARSKGKDREETLFEQDDIVRE
ncbi:MAG: hypothetical protein A2178_03205 [Planctomycetes bacterium GWC2_49_10]|nr:MAG: hypothetical protein A2178_03205 [Planctomycetes bacterium GWC2_49_10]